VIPWAIHGGRGVVDQDRIESTATDPDQQPGDAPRIFSRNFGQNLIIKNRLSPTFFR